MDDLVHQLQEANIGKVLVNEPLARHTTLKIGGPADLLIEPSSVENLKTVMGIVKKSGVIWRVIGRGSNLLVDDEGIQGVVIKLGKGLNHLKVDGEKVTVGGGYPFVPLATIISRKGLSGLEFAGGIPGSVGGAVYMNAGAHGSDVSEILAKAHILFEDGTMKWLSNKEMAFSYRTSVLQEHDGICVEAVFHLEKGDRDQIVEEMLANKDYRMDSQPYDKPCCGSVFRNPLPNYAGHLIEKAGLKGTSIGGAQISEMHANFIVNTGDARAEDVLNLIAFIKKEIREKYDVQMQTEVEMILKKLKNNPH